MEKLKKKIEEASAAIGKAEQKVIELMKETFMGKDVELSDSAYVVIRSEENGYKPFGAYIKHIRAMEGFHYPYLVYTTDEGYEYPYEDVEWKWNLNIVEAYVNSIGQPDLYEFPIDNKHMLEDFSDDFHGGEFTEYVDESKVTHQIFWSEGCACELSYRFGQNWVKFEVLSGTDEQRIVTMRDVEDIIKSYREHYTVKVQEDACVRIMRFYKSEDQL